MLLWTQFKKGQKGTKINESFYQEERIYSIKEAYQMMVDGMMKSYWDDKERKEAREREVQDYENSKTEIKLQPVALEFVKPNQKQKED